VHELMLADPYTRISRRATNLCSGVVTYEIQRFALDAGLLRQFAMLDYSSHPIVPGLLMGLGAGIGDSVKSFSSDAQALSPEPAGRYSISSIFFWALTCSSFP
jgi:hypothetical protein